jgi:hypothetical protein
MSREIIMRAIAAALVPGPPNELVAIAAGNHATISRGITREVMQMLPPERLALRAPWATGGAVITRDDFGTRAVVVEGDRCTVLGGSDGTIGAVESSDADSDAVSLLWSLQSDTITLPSVHELYSCLILRAIVEDEMYVEGAVSRWCAGDLDDLLRLHGLPKGRVTPRLVYATAHALDLPVLHPIPGAPLKSSLRNLAALIPPRWVMAHVLRVVRGRPDLAEVVMSIR